MQYYIRTDLLDQSSGGVFRKKVCLMPLPHVERGLTSGREMQFRACL
jgi:hypothetical protein